MKKTFSITGMLAGALLIIFGLVALCGGFGDADSYGGDSPYDSGYASFGADYYTYSVNNTAETASAVRGDTVTRATKDAVLETGYKLRVPLFIEQDEMIIINTQTGEYDSRG